MEKNIQSELERILEKNRQTNEKIQSEKTSRENKELLFLNEFYKVSKEIIRPAMEEIGKAVSTNGIEYRITEKADLSARDGRHEPAEITVSFFTKDRHPSPGNLSPKFSVTCIKRNFEVSYYESSWSTGGPLGPGKLENITVELIQHKILEVLKK